MTTTDDEEVIQHDDLWGVVDHIEASAKNAVNDSPDATLIELRIKRFKRLKYDDRKFVRQRVTGRVIKDTHRLRVDEDDARVYLERV